MKPNHPITRILLILLLLVAPFLVLYGLSVAYIKFVSLQLPDIFHSPYLIFGLYSFSLPMIFYPVTNPKYWISVLWCIAISFSLFWLLLQLQWL